MKGIGIKFRRQHEKYLYKIMTEKDRKKLKERKIPLKELMIRTQLKKSIDEYKSEGPHVTIAKKMKSLDMPVKIGMLMQYYISEPEASQKTKTGKKSYQIRI